MTSAAPRPSPVAQRYAAALYQAAVEQNALTAVQTAVSGLREALKDATLAAALASPRLSLSQRQALAVSLAGITGNQPVLQGFFSTLAANGRFDQLPAALAAFDLRIDAAAGRLRARVESAAALTEAQHQQLQSAIRQQTGASEVVLEETLEPKLLGGFRAFFGGRVWDASVQGSLSRLTRSLHRQA